MPPSTGTHDRREHLFSISWETFKSLQADLFPALAAVLDILLLRYFGAEEIVIYGRDRGGPAVPIRVALPDNPPFTELLDRVRQGMRNSSPGVDSRNVLLALGDITYPADREQFDIILSFREPPESGQDLAGCCEYNGALFDENRGKSFTRHFAALLREAAAKPASAISDFEMLDEAGKHRLLVEWNGENAGYPPYCAHELIEQQVERTPNAAALIFGDTQLSFRELNRRANQLAHYLRRKGAGPETPVGILMDASWEVIVAVVAILKSGGAYVSLDHYQPAHRLRDVIREARLSLVVTMSSNPGYRAVAGEIECICVDLGAAEIAREEESNPQSGVTPDNMAFVRFTSGSTGKPKGAVSIHRSITSRLVSCPLPDFDGDDVCLVNTSFGFGTKLFFPLILGSTVVVLPEDQVRNVNRLAEHVERYGITRLYMVPTHLRQLLSIGPEVGGRLKRVRSVTTGGEILTTELAARFRKLLPWAVLLNSYGGSEVGGMATLQPIAENSLAHANSIGRPVVNTRVYLLDRDMHPVPQGVAGEIYIGSGHMGRGYLNRPDLTAPRFVPDPFGNLNGGRLYRTGDLGRHFPDGRIEFLGRADRQVKVRGFRIELEEIEAALHDNVEVEQAAVTAQKSGELGDDNRLIAYIVAKPGARPGVSTLRRFLRRRLPEFMAPHAFVFLDRMPLNRGGKIDLLALPAPGTGRPRVSTVYETPRNAAELAIAEIWRGVLGVDEVGIDDNFIELGGDSLMATAVSARLQKRLGLDVPMELVLEWSIATIAKETAVAESR